VKLRALAVAALAALTAAPLIAADNGGPLTVYSGRSEALVAPLFDRFTERTGIEVKVSYQKTPALATQLLTEGADTPADLMFAQDSGYLTVLAERGLLSPLPQELLDQVDSAFRDPAGRWIGTSGRARVLVYSPERVAPDELPRSLADIADPRWKGRIGWAPGNASFQAHLSAIRHVWGAERTREWLEAVRANDPVVYPKNSPQVKAVAAGEIDLGWVNHYYLHKLKPQVGERAVNYSFPEPGDAGNVLMASGIGVLASSPHAEAARRLIEFLVSPESQAYFAQETFEYPVRPGVATHPDVPPLEALGLARVDQQSLTDLKPTLMLLQSLGLQ
jgi:iron(III) transport system substrate-binding protein